MSNFYAHSIHWETTNTKNRAFCVHFHFVGNNITLLCTLLRKKMMGNKTQLDICSLSLCCIATLLIFLDQLIGGVSWETHHAFLYAFVYGQNSLDF